MKKEHFCNALKVLKIIRIILTIILLFYTLSLCIIGHCATITYENFPMYQNQHNYFTQGRITAIENALDSENNYIFGYFSDTNNGTANYYFMYWSKNIDKMMYGEVMSNLVNWTPYFIGTYNGGVSYRLLQFSGDTLVASVYHNGSAFSQPLGNSNTSAYWNFVSNFQVYNNNTENKVVLLVYNSGENIGDDDVASEDMEKPVIEDYIPNWTNTPTFDNSNVESALESVYNGIVWLANNIKGTITGTGQYISDTVRWSIQKILNTIRDLKDGIESKINEVKNIILTVVDKIQDTIDYISQSYDSTKVNTAFNNMAIKTDYNNLTTLVNNAFSVFDSTNEPNTFRIPIHLENIPILHINTVQYIDLGWIYDSRSIIRAFMWCVTTFSLLYTIVDALPSYLQGNDE